MEISKFPLSNTVEQGVSWMHLHLDVVFNSVKSFIDVIESSLRAGLFFFPPMVLIGLLGIFAFYRIGRKNALLITIALMLIWDLGLWKAAMQTLSLVLVASGFSMVLGIPIGILVAESRKARTIITPVLDYMQATPSFVYLIPNVIFFGMGAVPGIIATVMFALPPPVRLTALGLSQIDKEVIEAGEAFGCNRWKLLSKIKLPLAVPSIMLGVNQCIMMSLSMVVIASLIGARGLGTEVIRALSQVNISHGIEAGLAVVLIAVVLDRLSLGAFRGRRQRGEWL